MKDLIVELLQQALHTLADKAILQDIDELNIPIERTRDRQHGDFASNIALTLARKAGMPPRELAARILEVLPPNDTIVKTEVAGPGFINFFVSSADQFGVVRTILQQAHEFGRSQFGQDKKILIEYVSANPTGPLHVGHGRGAAYGASVANLLSAIGYQVDREYYVNDAGRQMDILAASVYLRYRELHGKDIDFPENAYQGDYIIDIAQAVKDKAGSNLIRPMDELTETEPEKRLDQLIFNIKSALGDCYQRVHKLGLNLILENIRQDLLDFGVEFDRWYSEQSLNDSDAIDECIKSLKEQNRLYEKNGAWWFASTEFGDEKDRVVIRDNGLKTYFASDIAYHAEKYARGYDQIIDIWGADHHGYIARVKAALQAMGLPEEKLQVLLVQFVSLYRGQEKMQMSTRSGQFITLAELQDEVGSDATRFFYVMRKSEQHLDFDMELAKSSNKENPVYYIQYAHARICRLLEKTRDDGIDVRDLSAVGLSALAEEKELKIANQLSKYPEILQSAATQYEPHQLVYYLKELANDFHGFYDTHKIFGEENSVLMARLALCCAVRQVIYNGLELLGVSAPESM